jgi:predicted nucleic acid-binding protein
MVYLIDANVIIRFLVGDHKEHLEKSTKIFREIEEGSLRVEILETVLMEVFFVLVKFYKLDKNEVINDLKSILTLQGVVNLDKVILHETLTLVESKNIDFVDAQICAKVKLQNYKALSFDEDVKRC